MSVQTNVWRSTGATFFDAETGTEAAVWEDMGGWAWTARNLRDETTARCLPTEFAAKLAVEAWIEGQR